MINRAKFDVSTPGSFLGVKTNRQTSRIVLYILHFAHNQIFVVYCFLIMIYTHDFLGNVFKNEKNKIFNNLFDLL